MPAEFDAAVFGQSELSEGKLPRIKAQRPRKGYHHPATPSDIKEMLTYFGELSYYGVREIQLAQSDHHGSSQKLSIAKLIVPGKIILYEQPQSPWLLAGALCGEETEILETAGAVMESSADGLRGRILWSPVNLRNFMLFEGLMHEVGHHIIQQFKGKRTVQVLRLKDHELLAHHFARRCRLEYLSFFTEDEAK